MALNYDQIAEALASASCGFDHLFCDKISEAKALFGEDESPLHLLGLGVCSFLEAFLGMESTVLTEAGAALQRSEAASKKQLKQVSKNVKDSTRFPPGTLWELIHADTVILLGLTQALSESYMGYVQCLYSINSSHSKFTKLYKVVFPTGLDAYATPSTSRPPSRKPSTPSVRSVTTTTEAGSSRASFFGRWSGGSILSVSSIKSTPIPVNDGPIEEFIVSGTAFGFGLFNLVLSLLPAKVKTVVGFLGYEHDRRLALRALAVSAAKQGVHSVFAGLALMTYHGFVLLLSGYQADEAHILEQYRAIVDSIEKRYPTGSLWILNRARILRMSHDSEGAIKVLQENLKVERPHGFKQADALLVFELAWTLLSQRKYAESAEVFMKINKLNSWSHATYYFIAAGCHISLGQYQKAQELFDAIPALLEKRKLRAVKYLPTEVFIQRKLEFYRDKQRRTTGSEVDYAKSAKISPAEEIAIFWNLHSRIDKTIAETHIIELYKLSPAVTISSPYISSSLAEAMNGSTADLDTPDELAIRSLILGIVHRTVGEYTTSRAFLDDSYKRHGGIATSSWIGGVSLFELAVLDLKEMETTEREGDSSGSLTMSQRWEIALKAAREKLDLALKLCGSQVDLSSRLDSRIVMLKDEIALKMDMLATT